MDPDVSAEAHTLHEKHMKRIFVFLQLNAKQPSRFSIVFDPTRSPSNRSLIFTSNINGAPHVEGGQSA
jgi:hypothetical protein